jgi:hypothetical protein
MEKKVKDSAFFVIFSLKILAFSPKRCIVLQNLANSSNFRQLLALDVELVIIKTSYVQLDPLLPVIGELRGKEYVLELFYLLDYYKS